MAYTERNHYRISKLVPNNPENSLKANEKLALFSARGTAENSSTNLTSFEVFLKSKLNESNLNNFHNIEVPSTTRM